MELRRDRFIDLPVHISCQVQCSPSKLVFLVQQLCNVFDNNHMFDDAVEVFLVGHHALNGKFAHVFESTFLGHLRASLQQHILYVLSDLAATYQNTIYNPLK